MKDVIDGRVFSPVRCRRLYQSCWAMLFIILSVSAVAADKFDIVGLRLGMTPDEALKVLRSYGVKESTLDVSRQLFHYSDGLKHDYKTEDFISAINAAKDEFVDGKRKTDTFNLSFSSPPEGGRLVGMRRLIENHVDPVTGTQFLEALEAKYGEPAVRQGGVYRWLFGEGTKACRNYHLPDSKKGISREVYASAGGRLTLDRFQNPKVTNLEECANQLEYSVGGVLSDRPATRITAYMIDVQAWVKAEQATNKWLSDLAAAAAEKRKGQGQGPQL